MRIHVAGGDAEEQPRPAQGAKGVGTLPVGLADDAHAKALRLEQSPDQRHAEAGMVDVGVAGDENDVARIPAQRVHLGAGHGQEGAPLVQTSVSAEKNGQGRASHVQAAHSGTCTIRPP
jgi:hypothetical protein